MVNIKTSASTTATLEVMKSQNTILDAEGVVVDLNKVVKDNFGDDIVVKVTMKYQNDVKEDKDI